jgi:hypothetical protein
MKSFLASAIIMVILAIPAETLAERRGWGWYEGRPYGDYCTGKRWGGPYGMRKPVKTEAEARQVIERYFAARRMAVLVGRVEERKWFFLAEILDRDGTIIDETIVDKRTGRIRSIY